MSTIQPNTELVPGGGVVKIRWLLAAGDEGADTNYPGWADRNIQIEGTAGGATVTIHGSNDGINWRNLTDMAGDVLSGLPVGGAIKMIQENTLLIRPVVNGGDGTTALTLTMI